MPPRWLSLVIVVFWVTTTGWLLWKDLAPRFRTGEPPPYVIDLVEEVRTDARFRPHVPWKVLHNDQEVFHAETWVEQAETAGVYKLLARLTPEFGRPHQAVAIGPMQLRKLETWSQVTRAGDLLGMGFRAEARVQKSVLLPEGPMDVEMLLTGEIHDGRLFPRLRIQRQNEDLLKPWDFEPVPLPPHGAVLIPLHPVNRIQGLRPGQTWHMPLVDPFASMLPGQSTSRALETRVLPEAQMLRYKGRAVACWVIQYEGEGSSAQTWVQQDSGLVLRQEIVQSGERWVMESERELNP